MSTSADLLKELRIDRSVPPPPSRRRLWIALAIIGAVLAVGLVGWILFGRDDTPQVRTARAVEIGGGNGGVSVLDATGYVVARRIATVSSKITGRVREVLIEEGQHVKDGEVMATLDPVDADAARDLAAAQLAAARSQSGSVQAQLREAEANATRLDSLVEGQLVSQAQYEQAVAQRDALRAQLVTARRNAQVASDQLRIAENGVDNTVIRAPFAGVVIAKAAQPGEIVSPLSAGGGFTRTGIGTVVDMDSLEVEVDVGEAYIGRVQPEMPVEATLNAYPDWKIPGEVIAIVPTADRGKATIKVRIALNVRDPRIVPDMGVRVSFLETAQPADAGAPPPGVLVPGSAIVVRNDEQVAFVVAGAEVEQRTLQLGRTLGEDREVTRGLGGGEMVVLDPPEELMEGMSVRVADEAGDED
ncbi:efflux RND transporter periplasmic adaptor subunit [Lysobacter sp. D1-1-M9]|uniref:efflux RND transporter periplasmic adaptor subunit n=2 Tax=Novilysobacter TaxID=3382699 RepID=UPI002FC93045